MLNRSNKLLFKPKFFHFTTKTKNDCLTSKKYFSSDSISKNKKMSNFNQNFLMMVTNPILMNLKNSRSDFFFFFFFFSLILLTCACLAYSTNTTDKEIETRPLEGELENLTMIKKDLKNLIDREVDSFKIDHDQETFSKKFLEEMNFSLNIGEKEKVILSKSVDDYLINISFKGNRMSIGSTFDPINLSENEEIETDASDNEDIASDLSEDIDSEELNNLVEQDNVLVSIKTIKNNDQPYTIHFDCNIQGKKLFIQRICIEELPVIQTSNDEDPLSFNDNAIEFDDLNSQVKSRMYDLLDEFGIGDRLVHFIDFYRSSKIVKNSKNVLQYFSKFLDS